MAGAEAPRPKAHKLINPNERCPIDIEFVSAEFKRLYQMPDVAVEDLAKELKLINDETMPFPIRQFLINHLPFCVVQIIYSDR